MSHALELADHQLDHVAAALWTLRERGSDSLTDLHANSRIEDVEEAVGQLVGRGLARRDGQRIRLTASGLKLAEGLVRRHRLAELLFSAVLEVEDDRTVNRTACVMEHILSSSVTDSVCSFLGHPKLCPHGRPIPAGRCCRSFSNAVEPLVQPLPRLPVGRSARIVYIAPRDPARLVRLSNLGLLPGAVIRLRQERPAVVVAVGETTLALDRDIAAEIYVKLLSDPAAD